MAKKEKRIDYKRLVTDKKLPILTLDGRWHELFAEDQKTPRIRQLEQKVNDLLKQQGKLVNDINDMKRLKKSLLKDIVENMDISRDRSEAKGKKLDRNKQYIEELNVKLDASMEELAALPYEIKKVNEELVSESIAVFYTLLEENRLQITEASQWINRIREELKAKLLMKQDLEERNTKIYTYMHDILGPEVMELFDREHGV